MNFLKSILRIAKSVILVVLITIIVVFCLNNQKMIIISFNPLPWDIEIRLFFLVLATLLFGFILGIFVSSFSLIRLRISNLWADFKIKRLNQKLDKKDE